MIWVKKNDQVLAACDEHLLGKTFEQDKLCLEIKENFYKGQLTEEKQFIKELENATNINLVGEKTVSVAKQNGFVDEIKQIKGIPYVMIFKI